ncbi:winged helix-turn-helix domain-containing protein [Streptomyces sp. NPDC091268]|uniref:winged helix-turn-helix domain-containing protein n=1 Tax=Streptomyces sp. NPDC091268 TaxID=3365979 RepID=UPI0038021103
MNAPLPAPATRRAPAPGRGPRLQLVGGRAPGAPAVETAGGRVGYLVFLPAHVDPAAVMSAHGVRPEIHPLEPEAPLVPAGPGAWPMATPAAESVDCDDAIRVDRERRLAEVDGRQLELTYLEFDLLAHFVAHPYTVHTRDALISGIWGYGHFGDGRTVDVHVARLRRKLGPLHRERISTVRRVGYKYVPDASNGS